MWHVYTYTWEYYLALKIEKIFSFATTWMNLEDITLSEISLAQKNGYRELSLIGDGIEQNYMKKYRKE